MRATLSRKRICSIVTTTVLFRVSCFKHALLNKIFVSLKHKVRLLANN